MAAPSLSASGTTYSWNLSEEPSARPPETMILALVSSGRSVWAISSPTNLDRPGSAGASIVSTCADPPSPTAWKPDVRMVMTFLGSDDFTVWIALPA